MPLSTAMINPISNQLLKLTIFFNENCELFWISVQKSIIQYHFHYYVDSFRFSNGYDKAFNGMCHHCLADRTNYSAAVCCCCGCCLVTAKHFICSYIPSLSIRHTHTHRDILAPFIHDVKLVNRNRCWELHYAANNIALLFSIHTMSNTW